MPFFTIGGDMRRNALFAIALAAVCASPLQAQDGEDLLSSCSDLTADDIDIQNENPALSANARAAAEQVIEDVRFVCSSVATTLSSIQPAIGMGFSGGNPTLGMGGTLGTRFGLVPRIAVTARLNGVFTEVPDIFDDFEGTLAEGESFDSLPTRAIPLGALQADVALGVFNGITLVPMLGGLGSIDLLGSVAFIPVIDEVGLEDAIISWGAGARIGILKGGLVAPGLAVSGMYRRIGEVQFGDVEEEDPGEFATDLRTLSLRATASKGIAMFDFAVGAGYDKYTSDPNFNFRVQCQTDECRLASTNPASDEGLTLTMVENIDGEVETAAWNVFGNVGLSLLLLNLVGEIGYQQATDVLTGEDLEGRALTEEEIGEGRIFASIGLRLTL